jgi:hypothetical protein
MVFRKNFSIVRGIQKPPAPLKILSYNTYNTVPYLFAKHGIFRCFLTGNVIECVTSLIN